MSLCWRVPLDIVACGENCGSVYASSLSKIFWRAKVSIEIRAGSSLTQASAKVFSASPLVGWKCIRSLCAWRLDVVRHLRIHQRLTAGQLQAKTPTRPPASSCERKTRSARRDLQVGFARSAIAAFGVRAAYFKHSTMKTAG